MDNFAGPAGDVKMKKVRAEFHCHTIYSKDSLLQPSDLLAACRRKNIDRLVVTDHNTIVGALHAQKLDPTRVIVGEEIMTQAGELLAIFVKEEIPAGLPPEEAIERLRTQDAFIGVSHPFDRTRKGHWDPSTLEEIVPLVDAIEIFNARCMLPDFNSQAQEFARQHAKPGIVGSDAHTAYELGKATMLLPDFHSTASLKESLARAAHASSLSPPWIHLSSRYAVWRKKLGLSKNVPDFT
jgi:predicted metal-dependent phosphoesterase TrpH